MRLKIFTQSFLVKLITKVDFPYLREAYNKVLHWKAKSAVVLLYFGLLMKLICKYYGARGTNFASSEHQPLFA